MSRHRRLAPPVLVIALASALVGCGADAPESSSAGPSTTAAVKGIQRDEPLQVGDVEVPDVTGNPTEPPVFRMAAEPGHLLVAYFGYTQCPDVCPTSLAALRRAYSSIDAERAARIDTAMMTVDPRRDTPEILTTYLSGFFDDRYHALRTMNMELLQSTEDRFLASSNIVYATDGTPEVSHTGTTYAVDSDGTVLVEWPFGTNAKEIAADLDRLFDDIDQHQEAS